MNDLKINPPELGDCKNSEKLEIYEDTDEYWRKLWDKVDKAENSIFFLTYCMDNQFIANYTIIKLINALERKVPVTLMIEHLNYYPKNSLLNEFVRKGGIVIKPNNAEKILKHIKNGDLRKFFNRYHQKLYLVDNDLFIGSANIAHEYSSIDYGKFAFLDLNIYVKNTIAYYKIIRLFERFLRENQEQIFGPSLANYELIKNTIFKRYEELDKINLISIKYMEDETPIGDTSQNAVKHDEDEVTSENLSGFRNFVKKMRGQVGNLEYTNKMGNGLIDIDSCNNELFLEEKPPEYSEIQDIIYSMIKKAKDEIVIIQPYYFRVHKVDDLLIEAKKRGVKVKIITAFARDQPAYKHLYNAELFSHLLKENIQVQEHMYKFLHMKAYYVDHKYLTIGSMNNDTTSFIMNNESNYFIRKNEENDKVFKEFESLVKRVSKDCRDVNSYKVSNSMFRWISNRWWCFFVWSMEKLVPNRKVD